MPSFIQNIFAPRPRPIGIDFGTDTLRMSQVQFDGNDFKLIAAATAPVPIGIRADLSQRMAFFSQTVSDLLAQGAFRGRRVVLGLPSAWTFVRSFRTTDLEPAALDKALPPDWAPSAHDLHVRHIIAGELKHDGRSHWEVILMAARKSHVDTLLAAAAKAKVDVRGLTVEMSAMVDCFAHVYRRKADANSTSCYLDIGTQGSRVVIARGGRTVFMRSFPIGGDELNASVASRLKLHADDARLLRRKLSHAQTESADRPARGAAAETAASEQASDTSMHIDADGDVAARVEKAIRGPLYSLVQELQQCRQDHDAMFPGAPVDRMIFCGGEARNRAVCNYISSAIGMATQVGDPMVRLSKSAPVGNGIDRRQPQPMWAVSLGLTMGPAKMVGDLPRVLAPVVPLATPSREAA